MGADAMTLPQMNFTPPFNITRAGHLVLTSRDLAKARDFYTEVIGLKVSDETATMIHLRGVEERAHHSLTLKKTKDQPECERIGFRMFEEEDLEKAKVHFDARGMPANFVNVPFQGRTLHVAAPDGTPLEFCARMKAMERLHTRTHEHKGGAALRLDHFQVLVPDVKRAWAFYLDSGFRISVYSCVEDRTVGVLLHRKDSPHDLVMQEGAGPRLHHFGFVVQETHHLLQAVDAAGHHRFGGAIEHGPGRHGHSSRIYLRDPDGHRVALLLPPIQVIDIDDGLVRHEAGRGDADIWGPAPPQTLFEEATLFTGLTVRPPEYEGVPVKSGGSFEGLGFREAGTL